MSTPEPRLFVTGATGQLGRLVIEALLKRVPADSIMAGVRSLESAAAEDLRGARRHAPRGRLRASRDIGGSLSRHRPPASHLVQ
ncbi:protein of unknown function [Methylorubrum extorquens]|uniref:Thioester reductase (TE) domain-containing protein n=1 Tax=Methylorubrum extorquens TaxID=408 RepID=A0A2N9ALC4_METEX|nr:protein of unknown function [Methylorubrum extorquens]